LTELGRPAAVHDIVIWNNIRVEVKSIAGLGVGDAIITKIAGSPAGQANTAVK